MKCLIMPNIHPSQNSCLYRRMSASNKNRLDLEKSPYLLQHATNPVDWYPWGEEAFDKAKEENKPIFLSVGYSTCHWCHVMERESFENPEIGKLMNEHFVCIKVDREERPDVDRVYMTFIQATSGGGGWPMSVWLTPDLKPIVGGTYFPPDDRYFGKPGFKTILNHIATKWKEEPGKVADQGSMILDALKKATGATAISDGVPDVSCMNKCYQMLEKSFDPNMGGFSKAPKFPQPVNFNLMLRVYAQDPQSSHGQQALQMSALTLKKMNNGGIHDHVGQGFHRYSTDDDWQVPHFEKMLYDQAQLAVSYADMFQITKEKVFADVTRDILQYVSRDLSHPAGGFYSAEDADSLPTHDATDKKEGAFCVWSYDELVNLLQDPIETCQDQTCSDLFCYHYDVKKGGNVDPMKDPHEELKGKNVLIVRKGVADTASKYNLDIDKTNTLLQTCRDKLSEVRKKRPPPHLDDKMLTAWNGLMISGFAKAGQVLNNTQYTERAKRAAEFLYEHMYDKTTGVLLRSSYAGSEGNISQINVPIQGFTDDYASLNRGLLDLYEACYDQKWLKWAEQLQEKQNELFLDKENGGYFSSGAEDKSIVLRMKDDQDGAEPSANSISAMNLLRLSNFLDRPEWKTTAEKIFMAYFERITKVPIALPELVCALNFYHSSPKQIIIVGDIEEEDTKRLLECVHSHFLPNKSLIVTDGDKDSFLYQKLKVLESLKKIDGKATAYVCEDYTCSLPVNSVEEMKQKIGIQ